MPNSFSKALERFQHCIPKRPQYSTHKWLSPMCGAKFQYSPDATTVPKLEKCGITRMQIIANNFLYISRAVDSTMLVALNEIVSNQVSPTTDTIKKTNMLIEYAATQPDAIIHFIASDMCLHIDSDAAYPVQPKSRSRAANHFYLINTPPPHPIRPTPTPNGPILTKCQTIRTVMASATEAETGVIFLNGQQAVPMCMTLIEMGHPQPPTPIKTDIKTFHGILPVNMRRKRSKAFDMRFNWMWCRIKQKQFRLYW